VYTYINILYILLRFICKWLILQSMKKDKYSYLKFSFYIYNNPNYNKLWFFRTTSILAIYFKNKYISRNLKKNVYIFISLLNKIYNIYIIVGNHRRHSPFILQKKRLWTYWEASPSWDLNSNRTTDRIVRMRLYLLYTYITRK